MRPSPVIAFSLVLRQILMSKVQCQIFVKRNLGRIVRNVLQVNKTYATVNSSQFRGGDEKRGQMPRSP